jgi:hypothetical protein
MGGVVMAMKQFIVVLLVVLASTKLFSQDKESVDFDNPANYPLIGNWVGEWINPQKGHEALHPNIAAQVNVVSGNLYIVNILPELHKRAPLYMNVEIEKEKDELNYKGEGWSFTFSGDSCIGYGNLFGDKTYFKMSKSKNVSPTLGIHAPENAIELLADYMLSQWKHDDGRDSVTWIIKNNVLETVSAFWNNGQNRKDRIGGSIRTKNEFCDLYLHMEFRYPVEPGKQGQGRGNSGLFLHGIGEIQILNSYALSGYWNECGSIYKLHPAKVNAAAPPLQWQTYDVDLTLPRFNADGKKLSNAILTVRLNGIIIHNHLEVESNAAKVTIGLQDHINRLQYRNIWVVEK